MVTNVDAPSRQSRFLSRCRFTPRSRDDCELGFRCSNAGNDEKWSNGRDFDVADPNLCDQRHEIVIVHPSRLFRSCLTHAIQDRLPNRLLDFEKIEDALSALRPDHVALILIGFLDGLRQPDAAKFDAVVERIGGKIPIVVCGDCEDGAFVADLLSKGVRGYIPTSLNLDVAIHVLGLVQAGGVFAPASCLMNHKHMCTSTTEESNELDQLTAKQLAVVRAIREGKPNKTIAYELNMCESTVKVHVRSIMKKLQARNRTQVAFIANQILYEADNGR